MRQVTQQGRLGGIKVLHVVGPHVIEPGREAGNHRGLGDMQTSTVDEFRVVQGALEVCDVEVLVGERPHGPEKV